MATTEVTFSSHCLCTAFSTEVQGCCVAKHRARNGLQISGFCLTHAQAAPDRHTEFCGYVWQMVRRAMTALSVVASVET